MAAITANNFLYVALSNSNGVGAFSFDASTGALTPVSGSPFAAGKTPLNVTASSNALYVSNSGDQTISAFSWDSSTGGLIPVSGSPFNAQFTNELTVLGDQYLYTPSINNVFPPTTNAILGFAVGGSGSLTPIKGSPFQSRTQLSGGVAAF
jgi:6-phosphogluconolactonase (cycloisomerase 2 family)